MDFDYSEFYNDLANANKALTVLASERYVRILLPYLPENKAAKILEIGPGNGLTLKLLAEMGYTNTVGLEVDKNLAMAARANGINVDHVAESALVDALTAHENSFELVFCMHVIEHVPKDQQIGFVRAAGQSLTTDGYFVCETPNALGATANYFRYNDWTHTSIFTPASLRFLYRTAGLDVAYAGGSPLRITPPRGGPILSAVKLVAEHVLRFLSNGISRIHYVAEFGMPGFDVPLTSSLLAVGKRSVNYAMPSIEQVKSEPTGQYLN
jgi:2-polyprenyl-3-methyl-5-hydroxy-6-metoxy-1,4-benzoquinol methylase